MMDAKPVEWCLVWVGPCLPSSEWAAWSQAATSVVALVIALYAAFAPLKEAHASRVATATLLGSGILVTLDQSIACLGVVAGRLKERIDGSKSAESEPRNLVAMLDSLSLPELDALLGLSGRLPDCAIQLLRARNATLQIQSALKMLTHNLGDRAYMVTALTPLYNQAVAAAVAFHAARVELDRFVPQLPEGGQTGGQEADRPQP